MKFFLTFCLLVGNVIYKIHLEANFKNFKNFILQNIQYTEEIRIQEITCVSCSTQCALVNSFLPPIINALQSMWPVSLTQEIFIYTIMQLRYSSLAFQCLWIVSVFAMEVNNLGQYACSKPKDETGKRETVCKDAENVCKSSANM